MSHSPAPSRPAPWQPTRLTLERVLTDLGSTVLEPLTTISDLHQLVTGVVAYDPFDDLVMPPGSIVLGIGLTGAPEIGRCLEAMDATGAVMLIARGPDDVLATLREEAVTRRIAVATLVRGASWTQLSNLINALLLDSQAFTDDETIDGLPSGDLFAVANAIASLLDAPITIEDRNSRVLAFSDGQDAADGPRIETVLGRQVPLEYTRRLQAAGFFTRLYSSPGPVSIRLESDGVEIKNRAAIAVRAGGEVLGSIWAALPGEIDSARAQIFCDVAKIAAMHMLRLRAGGGLDRRLKADLLATALEGGEGAQYAIRKLGIGTSPIAVFALGVHTETLSPLDEAIEVQRISDAVTVYLAAVRPEASAARVGSVILGILPVPDSEDGEQYAARVAREIIQRAGIRIRISGGIGPIVTDPRDLLEGREGARTALRVSRSVDDPEQPVAVFSQVFVDSLLLDLRDQVAARRDLLHGPVHRLHAHDLENSTDFVRTLDTWLTCMGDVSRAAEILHVHANTLRYRLRRLSEIAGLDLGDEDARFAAQLLLRIDPDLRAARPTAGEAG